jgi:glycosyltransferase involved in cell wall biosynthesis
MSYLLGMFGPINLADFREHIYPNSWRDDLPKGLGGTPVNLLSCELIKRGHNLLVVSLDLAVEEEVILQGPNLKICIGPYRAKGRARDVFSLEREYLLRVIKRERPNIIHAQWTYEYALAAQASGLPHIITAHDAPINILRHNFIPYRVIRTIMAYWVLLRAKRVISVSPYVAKHLRRYMGYFGAKEVIPNGMPSTQFEKIKPERGLSDNITFVTILPGWNGLKNGKVAIEAFAIHRRINPQDKLIMFGLGHGLGQAAEQWAIENNVDAGIEFAGHTPYQCVMDRLASEVDVLVHPSLEEAQPMVLIEAMALSIPVIGGENSGGVPWTLDDGAAGLLVDVKSPVSVAAAMTLLANNKQIRQDIGDKGLDLALKRFHLNVVTSKYETIYQELFNNFRKDIT